jgi:rhamnose utilization protein RhaD (predicted bifunctional aldolase and dehydrogenase)
MVQGPGGNTSMKISAEMMLIKASGECLAALQTADDLAAVRYPDVVQYLASTATDGVLNGVQDDQLSAAIRRSTRNCEARRASIETAMHTVLDRFVLHLHPLYVNVILCATEWRAVLQTLFGTRQRLLFIPFQPPGYYLAMAIRNGMQSSGRASIIFLQNHGLIVHGDSLEEAAALVQWVTDRARAFVGARTAERVASTQVGIDELFHIPDLFPDTVVFRSLHHTLAHLPPDKMQHILATFQAGYFIHQTIRHLDWEPALLPSPSIDYIRHLEQEKYRHHKAQE